MKDPRFSDYYAGRLICVTGGAGFIGSHLVEALVNHGAKVRVLDDLSTGREENLAPVADRVSLIRGSILDRDHVGEAVNGVDIVYHLAALTSVPKSVLEPEHYMQVNAMGTLAMLEAARAAGVGRFIFAASSSAYGSRGGEFKKETVRPDPQSPYGVAKCTGEQLLIAYSHCYEMHTVSLRYFNIFGSRQRPDSPYAAVLPLFAQALLSGKKPIVYGDGTQTRDFTHVSNAVHANLLAGSFSENLRGEIINVACGVGFSVNHLLNAVAEFLSVEPACEFHPPRAGEILHSQADVTHAKKVLGYEPIMSFENGLREALPYYVETLGN